MSINIKNAKDMSAVSHSSDKLILEQQRLNNEERRMVIDNYKVNHLQNKIEQARRNVEVLVKVSESFENSTDQDLQGQILEILKINLNVLKETANIK